MIAYFKYDNGNAFLLDGQPYSGFFHVINGIAYTDKVTTTFTKTLSPKGNFLAEFYLKGLEFDVSSETRESASPYILNSFGIFNKSNIEQVFEKINDNNLLTFKHLVIQNPKLFPIARTNTHFYGLPSTDADIRNDDVPSGKRSITHIDPFAFDSEWNFLDNIVSGDFAVSSDNSFIYFCSDGTIQYTLSGSFDNQYPITLISNNPSDAFFIKYDTLDNRLFVASLSSIKIYDLQNFYRCQTFTLLDEISLDIDSEFKNLLKVGKNIRTEVKNSILYLRNKYSTETFATFTFSDLKIDSIISLDIREVDDFIVLLGIKDGEYVLITFDTDNFANSYTSTNINDVTDETQVLFSSVDSNVFYSTSRSSIQGRLVSNPKNYFGISNNSLYFYIPDYIYDQTNEYWNTIPIKYNSNSLPSNTFNNILLKSVPINGNQYLLTHNIGRIYASKIRLDDTYLHSIPLGILKSYTGTSCSESSFGFYFNTTISNLVKDTLRLYYLAAETYSLSENQLTKNVLSDLNFEIGNLYLNGNETVNVVSVQRILYLINFIQNELISST